MKNRYEINGDVTTVYDSKGRTFLIDTDMIEYVGRMKWFVQPDKQRVMSTESHITLHRYLLGSKCESIDHINRNRLDNRMSNLRACTTMQNNMNRGRFKSNTSGYKGVTFDKSKGKYKASIGLGYKRIHIGYYCTAEEAGEAYKRRANELYGEYSPYSIRN